MPLLIGFILGVIVTVAGAYEYDASTGRSANGLSADAAGGQPPLVNWNVVGNQWQNFQANVRATTGDIERKLKQHTG